jgi:hypothetical protein
VHCITKYALSNLVRLETLRYEILKLMISSFPQITSVLNFLLAVILICYAIPQYSNFRTETCHKIHYKFHIMDYAFSHIIK